jgi:hypothetical protein
LYTETEITNLPVSRAGLAFDYRTTLSEAVLPSWSPNARIEREERFWRARGVWPPPLNRSTWPPIPNDL